MCNESEEIKDKARADNGQSLQCPFERDKPLIDIRIVRAVVHGRVDVERGAFVAGVGASAGSGKATWATGR